MKSWLRWSLIALAVLVVGIVGLRTLKSRSATGAPNAVAAASAASTPAPVMELAAQDVLVFGKMPLTRELEVSGSLKAIDSAFVKARVATEIKTLLVREGDSVRAGQVLGQLDTTEFDLRVRQAEQQAAAARAQVDIAQRQLTNNKALVAQGFISPTALDTSVSTEAGAQATLQAALAAVELARKSLSDAKLVAPIAGMVSQRLAQPGERVALDARILEIVDLSRLELEAAIAPQDIPALRVGAKASLTVDGSTEAVAAVVARINPSAQAGSRTVPAYLSVAGHRSLRNGSFAKGAISLDQRTTLALPLSAVRSDQALPYAIAVANGRAQLRTLTLGVRGRSGDLDVVEVLKGLTEGEQVLAGTAGLVPNGVLLRMPVQPGAAASSPAASR
jgi:RND family efflux transporter MFP subunit